MNVGSSAGDTQTDILELCKLFSIRISNDFQSLDSNKTERRYYNRLLMNMIQYFVMNIIFY